MSDLNKLAQQVREFCEAREWDPYHGPKDLAIGLVTEASEFLEIFRFVSEKEQDMVLREKREQISDEMADTFFFLLRFADRYGFDLAQALENKMRKNAERYPVDKARASNKKYDEL